MKLNEYIRIELAKRWREDGPFGGRPPPTPNLDKIEKWIADWYQETYNRMPPTWLATDSSKEEMYDELKKELKE